MNFVLTTHKADNVVIRPPDEQSIWKVAAMTQGLTSGADHGSPLVCILWQQE